MSQAKDWEEIVIDDGIDEQDNSGQHIQEIPLMQDADAVELFLKRFDINVKRSPDGIRRQNKIESFDI